MTVKVYIPTPLRKFTGDNEFVDAEGADINGVLSDLEIRYPGLGEVVFDAERQIIDHVVVFLNNEEISTIGGLEAAVEELTTITGQKAVKTFSKLLISKSIFSANC